MPSQPKVLVADDQAAVLEALSDFFSNRGYEVIACSDGGAALAAIRSEPPDLVVVDASMPVLSGIDVLRHLRFVCGRPELPAIVITGRADPRITFAASRAGAHAVLTKPFRLADLALLAEELLGAEPHLPEGLSLAYDPLHCLEAITSQAGPALVGLGLSLAMLAQAVDRHDPHGRFHSLQVAELSVLLGTILGRDRRELPHIRLAALVHDTGKLFFPGPLLAGTLTPGETEWQLIRRHPETGAGILRPVAPESADMVLYHHERWDGSGYPSGLAGEEIPVAARVLAVAEAYAAMTSRSVYAEPLAPAEALAALHAGSGTQFDPGVVAAFARLLQEPVPCSDV